MSISGRWNLILLVSFIKDLEEDAVRSCTSNVRFVEDLNDVLDVFLVGDAVRHLEVVEKEGRDIRSDREDLYFLILFDEVPVVSFPVKDDEGDFVLDKLPEDVLGQGGFTGSRASEDAEMTGEF